MFARANINSSMDRHLKTLLRDWADLIKTKRCRVNVNGTYKNGAKYPTDIDLRILCNVPMPQATSNPRAVRYHEIKQSIKPFYNAMRNMALRHDKKNGIYFIDFECGLDYDFFFNLQISGNGKFKRFDPEKMKKRLERLRNRNRLTEQQYNTLVQYCTPTISMEHMVNLCTALQSHSLLSWTQAEVLAQTKKKRNGPNLHLESVFLSTRNTLKYIILIEPGRMIDIDVNILFYLQQGNLVRTRWYLNDIQHCCSSINRGTADLYSLIKMCFRHNFFKVLKRIRTTFMIQRRFLRINNRKKRTSARKEIAATAQRLSRLSNDLPGMLNHISHQCTILLQWLDTIKSLPPGFSIWLDSLKQALMRYEPAKHLVKTIDAITGTDSLDSIKRAIQSVKTFMSIRTNHIVYPLIKRYYDHFVQTAGPVFPLIMQYVRMEYDKFSKQHPRTAQDKKDAMQLLERNPPDKDAPHHDTSLRRS